ncbi:MAG TPA: hypothetical protein VH044_04850 [Polyangiaceae bacterium]|jgi:hypothetical protein|nr:hypothetical protein [Polyangiaceae bacterium]
MKRAIAASCFAAAFFPGLAHAGDDRPSPALPPLPAPADSTPTPQGPGVSGQRPPADVNRTVSPEAPDAPETTPPDPSPDPSPDRSPDEPAEGEPARLHRIAWSIEGGYAHHVLFGVPINSGELSLVVGANFRRFSISGFADGTFGSTVDGLRVVTATYGPLFEGHFGVLRLGAGARLGLLYVPRATSSDSLASLGLGAMGRVTVDVLGADSAEGLFVVAKGTADWVGTPLYAVTVGLGVRFLRL